MSRVAAAVVVLAAVAAGCAEPRVEYRYRPSYGADPNAPKEVTLADGTSCVFFTNGDIKRTAAGARRAPPKCVAPRCAAPGRRASAGRPPYVVRRTGQAAAWCSTTMRRWRRGT